MARLRPWLDHGILELDTTAAARAMGAIAPAAKNDPFAGSRTGGKDAACTLVETAGPDGLDPLTWLADTPARIPDCKITKVDGLLPWHWTG